MKNNLTSQELILLLQRVFGIGPDDTDIAVLVDLPDAQLQDTPAWQERRHMAAGWVQALRQAAQELGRAAQLVLYRNARHNNADLPEEAWLVDDAGKPLPGTADQLDPQTAVPFTQVFQSHSILLAVTQLSATAPLKVAAKEWGFRAATMPGFGPQMVPTLRLDYEAVAARVDQLKGLLDAADHATVCWRVQDDTEYQLTLDLRHRQAHASTGLLRQPRTAGNLPSGEAYIVPYEGELPGDPSRSAGAMPVELEGEVVVYEIQQNRARQVLSQGAVSRKEAQRLQEEPAYGNLAELGLGVLADFGATPVGEILLDEKLGLHIAFGRSEHFGGQVGPAQFSSPEAVVHIDRVYLPSTQPQLQVVSLDLHDAQGHATPLMRQGAYVVQWTASGGVSGPPSGAGGPPPANGAGESA